MYLYSELRTDGFAEAAAYALALIFSMDQRVTLGTDLRALFQHVPGTVFNTITAPLTAVLIDIDVYRCRAFLCLVEGFSPQLHGT